MTVIGEAFVAISPESAGFVTKLQSQFAGLNLTGLIAPAAIAAATVGIIEIGEKFEAVRHQIEQETGATGHALEGIFGTVKEVFKDVPSSLKDATAAVDELFRRGVPLGPQLEELAKQELFLAKITKSELGPTVEQTTAIFAKFAVPFRDQPKTLDAIFKAVQQGGKSLTDLLTPLQANASALQQFGFSIEESAALIATLQKAGVNVQPSLVALRLAFSKIAKEGGDPKERLEGIIKSLTSGVNPTKAMADALKLFGSRSGLELATAIQKGRLSLEGMLEIITEGKDGIIATGEATLSLGDRIQRMAHNALVAFEPLGTALVEGLGRVINDLSGPLANVANEFGQLAVAIAPVAAIIGGALLLAFKAMGPVFNLFATGLGFIADTLNLLPGPIRGVVLALGLLAVAFRGLSLASIGSLLTNLPSVLLNLSNPVTIAIAAITALGAAVTFFRRHSEDGAKAAHAMSDAMFDIKTGAAVFKDGVTNATDALTAFFRQQEDDDKLHALDDAIKDTGISLREVAVAIAGPVGGIEKLKQRLVDTSGWNAQMKAMQNAGIVALGNALAQGTLTTAQEQQILAAQNATNAVQDQADAYAASTQQTLTQLRNTGDLSDEQHHHAEEIIKTTGALGGYGAALNFANEAVAEHTRRLAEDQVKELQRTGGMLEFQKAIIAGTVGENDAADASQKFGIQLEDAKKIIKDTTTALQAFVQKGTSGFPDSSAAIDEWHNKATAAFEKLAKDTHDKTGDIKQDLRDLNKAADPQQLIDNAIKQADQIAKFADNLKALVAKFPFAVQTLLNDADKASAAALAERLVGNQRLAAGFDAAQAQLSISTSDLAAFVSGPGAQKLADAGIVLGTAGPKAAANAIKKDKALQEALSGNAKDAAEKATGAVRNQRPAFEAAMRFLAARGNSTFKPDLKPQVTKGVLEAVAALDRDKTLNEAYGRRRRDAEHRFNPDLASSADKALDDAKTHVDRDHTVGDAHARAAKKAAEKFKPNIKAQVSEQFAAAATIVLGLKNIGNVSGKLGEMVGISFGQGIATGITSQTPFIRTAAEIVVAAAAKAAREKAESSSPSKVAMRIGADWTRGLAIGITSGVDQVRTSIVDLGTVVTSATSNIVAGFNDTSSIDALQTKLDKLLKSTSGAVADATNAAAAEQSPAAQALANLISSATSTLPDVGSTISSFASNAATALDTLTAAEKDYAKAAAKTHSEFVKRQGLLDAIGPATAATATAFGKLAADAKRLQPLLDLHGKLTDAQRKAQHDARDIIAGDKQAFAEAQRDLKRLQSQLASSTERLRGDRKDKTAAEKAVEQAQRALDKASDPATFVSNLRKQNRAASAFLADLRTLTKGGFLDLAKQLAAQGPEVAGKLAAGFADNKSKSKAAEKAIDFANSFATKYTDAITKLFGGDKTKKAAESGAAALSQGLTTAATTGATAAVLAMQTQLANANPKVHVTSTISGPNSSAVSSAVSSVIPKQVTVPITFVPPPSTVTIPPPAAVNVSLHVPVPVIPVPPAVPITFAVPSLPSFPPVNVQLAVPVPVVPAPLPVPIVFTVPQIPTPPSIAVTFTIPVPTIPPPAPVPIVFDVPPLKIPPPKPIHVTLIPDLAGLRARPITVAINDEASGSLKAAADHLSAVAQALAAPSAALLGAVQSFQNVAGATQAAAAPSVSVVTTPTPAGAEASTQAILDALRAVVPTSSTLALDLTINLPDGEQVDASVEVPIKPLTSVTQRVRAEVHAT